MDNTEKYGNLVLLTEDGTIDNNVSLDNIVGCLNNMIDYLNAEAEYAQKLYDMIHENEQLDDWMESHIAQMADDISEVYHALSYDKKQHK